MWTHRVMWTHGQSALLEMQMAKVFWKSGYCKSVLNIASHLGTAVALNQGVQPEATWQSVSPAPVITRRQLQSERQGGARGAIGTVSFSSSALIRFTAGRSPAGLMLELIAPLALKE
ncbi:unnamed protein product [Boreogadus saida]